MKGNAPLCFRKVNVTFAIRLHDLIKTLQKLHNIDMNIEFTMESES